MFSSFNIIFPLTTKIICEACSWLDLVTVTEFIITVTCAPAQNPNTSMDFETKNRQNFQWLMSWDVSTGQCKKPVADVNKTLKMEVSIYKKWKAVTTPSTLPQLSLNNV